VVEEAEKISKLKINSAYVSLPGDKLQILQKQATKAISNKEQKVTENDIISTILDVGKSEVDPGSTIIDIIPDVFELETGEMVKDPTNRKSSKITLYAQAITARKSYINELKRVFEKAGLSIDGYSPKILAEKKFYLEDREQQENTLIIDMGYRKTEIGLFIQGTFIYANTLEIGGNDITADMEYVFGISYSEAEKLKRTYNIALKEYIKNDNNISLSTVVTADPAKRTIKPSQVSAVIEGRLTYTIEKIFMNLREIGLDKYIKKVIIVGQSLEKIDKSELLISKILGIETKKTTNRIATKTDENKLIASVFLNRLAKGMKLQTDPSANYAADKLTGAPTQKELTEDSPYNTYTTVGLPPGPIASTSTISFEALNNAEKTDYLYFLHATKDGKGYC